MNKWQRNMIAGVEKSVKDYELGCLLRGKLPDQGEFNMFFPREEPVVRVSRAAVKNHPTLVIRSGNNRVQVTDTKVIRHILKSKIAA